MKKKINKYDITLILIIIIINSVFIYYNSKNIVYSDNNIVVIYSNNELVGEYVLSDYYKDEFTIKTEEGYNTIKIENNKVWIDDSDCKDQYCVHQGKISGVGEVVICLPHKLLIKIVGNDIGKDVDFIAK